MYEVFKKLLEGKNITAYRLSVDTGIPQATLSDWKRGRSIPKIDKLKKIADYLGVTVDYLSGKEQSDDLAIPHEFVVMARKSDNLSEEQKKKLYSMLDKTIDDVLSIIDKD